jgi:hypothetical protein
VNSDRIEGKIADLGERMEKVLKSERKSLLDATVDLLLSKLLALKVWARYSRLIYRMFMALFFPPRNIPPSAIVGVTPLRITYTSQPCA